MANYFADWIGATITTPPRQLRYGDVHRHRQRLRHRRHMRVSGPARSRFQRRGVDERERNQYQRDRRVHGRVITRLLPSTPIPASRCNQLPVTCTGANYSTANFGVLIFPQGSAALSIDSVTYTWDEHGIALNAQGGLSFIATMVRKSRTRAGSAGGSARCRTRLER